MKERPILFSGSMVRAILGDQKSQTRRVVRIDPLGAETHWHNVTKEVSRPDEHGRWGLWSGPGREIGTDCIALMRCPFGVPGDRLWVRETWNCEGSPRFGGKAFYRADGVEGPAAHRGTDMPDGSTVYQWRPSIHMPRWASRIALEVTGVRLEQLQAITTADVLAEGLREFQCGQINEFRLLWDSLNAKRDYGWDMNPWVWVVEFKRVMP